MSKAPGITVHGRGNAAAVPDEMELSFALHTEDPHAATAFSRAAEAAARVIHAVTLACPEARLATTGVGLSARTVWRDEQSVLVGYDAETGIEAANIPLEAVSMVLGAAVDAGGDALRIHALRAVVSDPGPALLAAREAAFADALAKAGHLAQLAGSRLGAVVQVREIAESPGQPLQRLKATAAASSPMPVVAGQQDLAVHLQVQWELLADQVGPDTGNQ